MIRRESVVRRVRKQWLDVISDEGPRIVVNPARDGGQRQGEDATDDQTNDQFNLDRGG